MARAERDREDLIAEATGLSPRAEVLPRGQSVPIVAGFGKRGELRLYFSPDHMLQFDAEGGLRRGFWEGHLIRTHGDHVVVLTRNRSAGSTELRRRRMTAAEEVELVDRSQRLLGALLNALEGGTVEIPRVVGAARGDFSERLENHLRRCLARLQSDCWLAPAVPTKRR